MTRDYDAVVIGASIGGLAAAALLAKSGARVLLLEEQLAPPEPHGPLFALDPVLVESLELPRHGFAFCRRELVLTGWDDEAPALTLSRDRRQAARALARLSPADAAAWGPFQADLFARARALRAWWWSAQRGGTPSDLLWPAGARARFTRECLMGAEDFLARHLESPRLISLLLHDALLGGLAPSEPGAALALIWRAAQQAAGLQGVVALAAPGSLVAALRAAGSAEHRMGAMVSEIVVSRGAVAGVRLADGTTIAARTVLSSLPRGASERLAGIGRPAQTASVGEAAILLTLHEGFVLPSALANGRAVLAPPAADYADGHEAARAGRLPGALPLAVVAETPSRLFVTMPLAPVSPPSGWPALKTLFAAAAIKSLSRHIPGLAGALTGVTVMAPRRWPRADLAQLLAPAAARAATGVRGLYLCGDSAEPLPCVSGRAGRFAAHCAQRTLQ